MIAGPSTSDRPYSRKEVVELLKTAVTKVSGDDASQLREQLSDLAAYMDTLRHELAQLRSIEISHNHIPAATDELDAVVGETESATGRIMDACDRLQNHVANADSALAAAVTGEVTAIYEACSFQDITGQRITKVIKGLKHIEAKVTDILKALGHTQAATQAAAEAAKRPAATVSSDAALLNGPQLGGKGISQEEIDKLLASFD